MSSAIWTDSPPKLSGWYWWWNGDVDSEVLPVSVMYSGFSCKCFVSRGQLGIDEARDVDEFGGWWTPCRIPEPPIVAAVEMIKPSKPSEE